TRACNKFSVHSPPACAWSRTRKCSPNRFPWKCRGHESSSSCLGWHAPLWQLLLPCSFLSSPKRRKLPVGKRAPQPLRRPEAEIVQPERAGDELEDPNREYDGDLPNTFDLAEEAETIAIKEGRAEQRLHQVVGKRHPADRRQRPGDEAKPRLRTGEHDES